MKRTLLIILTAVILVSVIGTAVTAADNPDVELSAGTVVAVPGETVEIPIVITKNDGFCGLNVQFTYPEELTFVSITNEVRALTCTNNVTTVWDGAENYTGTGTLAILKLKVSETARNGAQYVVGIKFIEAFDAALNDVTVATESGTVTVGCSHGDTTTVPKKDATCKEAGYTAGVFCNGCSTFISGHEEIPKSTEHSYGECVYTYTCSVCEDVKVEAAPPQKTPGDFTGDGRVNNDDVLYLLWHTLFGDEYPIS